MSRRLIPILSVLCALLAAGAPLPGSGGAATELPIDLPFQKFVLKNGLTVILHEDHKAPIIAVNVWYHVGSKNESPGKTGFAHLFEHLMFTGSGHFQEGGSQRAFFEAMERIGATDVNGTTSGDRTDFFENVPKNALEVALWLESDRMGHLLEAVDQRKLDVQRGIVQNEKRQNENQPYGMADELITKGTAPPGHPYSWTTIGSMEDLNAASLEDVRKWFKTYYGAANAVLVLAGDIDPQAALEKVERYFGDIPPGPPVARFQKWIPEISGTRRQTVADRVPQARFYKVWNIPPYGEPDSVYLNLLGDVLAYGKTKTARLYKRLVYDEQLATEVSTYADLNEISGQFGIVVTARPQGDLHKIEKAVDEELAKLLADGPTADELERVKAQELSAFVQGIERIGGFGGKSDLLAMNQTYRGDPAFYKVPLDYLRRATVRDVRRAGRQWLARDAYILEVHPYPDYQPSSPEVDRSHLPAPGSAPEITFPALQHTNLENGLKIMVAERHATPLVDFSLQVDAGFAADQFARPGTARLAMDLLDAGTARRTALQISDQLASLGATLRLGADLDTCTAGLTTLPSTLDRALEIYADVILDPTFPPADFARLQKQAIARIRREKTEPVSMALRVFPRLLYGSGHAYGCPLTGSGTEASIRQLTRADMEKFHATWFKPNNATLIVVGDTTLSQILPRLDRLFGNWKPGTVPAKDIARVEPPSRPSVYMIDRPGSIQSLIFAGLLAPPRKNPHEIAIETMNTILGGSFTSRLNLNLREDKHWAYGARSLLVPAKGERLWIAYASVQTDKTRESMMEMEKELRGLVTAHPITEGELSTAQKNETLRLPGMWETDNAVLNSIAEMVRFGLPDDYFTAYPGKVRALTVETVSAAAEAVVRPDQLIWVVVGDRARIEPGITELHWGTLYLMDADGNPISGR